MSLQSSLVPLKPTSASVTGAGSSVTINDYSIQYTSATALNINGIFSATYGSYLYLCRTVGSANENVLVRLRSSGSDFSNTNYFYQRLVPQGGANTNALTLANNYMAAYTGTSNNGHMMLIASPFENTVNTGFLSESADGTSGSRHHKITSRLAWVQSFDGITLYPASGTFTGRIMFYGVTR